jgi:RNA polymerase sigma-70 factor (ECF subfamily)
MIEPLYREQAPTIRALAYRMTGSAADADEIAQETFTRALASPPGGGPNRQWLLSVAANLSRDRLRRRKRAAYVGPWLPEAVEVEAEPDSVNPERRYGLRESASFAFLLALEPLTSRQRAVLLLRDVFELSVEETAAALKMADGAVRVMHHRARAALEGYDERRSVPTRERLSRVRSALERLAAAVASGDPARVEEVLAEHATLYADGAGRYGAVTQVVHGARTLAKFALFSQQRMAGIASSQAIWSSINGGPAIVVEASPPPGSNVAPRVMLTCDVDADGRIVRLYVIAAPEKLGQLASSERLGFHQVHGERESAAGRPGHRAD